MSSTSSIAIPIAELDPTLTQLGLLAGLLTPGQDAATLNLETDWFENPVEHIREIPAQRGDAIFQLLESLLGSVAGNALGAPQHSLSGNWYPIQNPDVAPNETPTPTGLYFVTSGASAGSPPSEADNNDTTMGLGLMYPFTIEGITLTVYGYVPLLNLPTQNGSYFALGTQPAEFGLEVKSASGSFGSDEVSFDGLKLAVQMDFTGGSLARDITPEIVLLNLKLPGQAAPQDQSLISLIEHGSIDEWIKLGFSILAAQLAKAETGSSPLREVGALIYDALALLGLAGDTPEFDWETLIHHPDQIVPLLYDWLRAIAGSPASLQSWLNLWASLRHGVIATEENANFVTGSGVRSDPWAIELSEIAAAINVSFTVATEVDSTGNLFVYPGVRVATNILQPLATHSPLHGLSERLGVQGKAALELIEFVIPPQHQAAPDLPLAQTLFPSFELAVELLNALDQTQPLIDVEDPNPPLASPVTDQPPRFRLGAAQIGFSYLNTATEHSPPAPATSIFSGHSGTRVFTPSFKLIHVDTALGSWQQIDLTNFDQDVQVFEQAISALVQKALTDFFGTEGDAIATSLAVILGLAAPDYEGKQWPVGELLINTPAGLEAVIKNPLAALGAYYTRCLNTLDDAGQPVWRYLLPSFATLLGGAAAGQAVSQQAGTAAQPWQIELFSFGVNKPGIYLQVWQPDATSPPAPNALHLALFFGVPLTLNLTNAPPPLAQVDVQIGLQAELLYLQLPDGDGSGTTGAHWLPGVAALLQITGANANGQATPLQTPALGGVSLQLEAVSLSTGWARSQGFYWAALISQIQLNYEQKSSVTIPEIAFRSGALQQDMQSLGELAELVMNAIGLWLLSHGGRGGVTLTATLGLLPNLPDILNGSSPPDTSIEIPPGLQLPAHWPTLQITDPATFFTQPWADLRQQIGAIFSDGANAEAMMQLLGWAITGEVPAAPAQPPAGTLDDPWSVTLANLWDIEALIWAEEQGASSGLGFGVRRVMSSTQQLTPAGQGVQLDVVIRLDVAQLPLGLPLNSPPDPASALPRFSLLCNVTNPQSGAPLVFDSVTGLRIGSAQLGLYANLDFAQGFNVSPVLALYDAQLSSAATPATVELVQVLGSPVLTAPQGLATLETLLNALTDLMIQATGPELDQFPALAAVFELLNDVGLAQTAPVSASPLSPPEAVRYLGINPGAWQSLLSNPGAFLVQQMNGVLQDPLRNAAFFEHLADLLHASGLTWPAQLAGVPELLAAFGLTQPTANGYAVSVSAWLNLFEHPVQFLEEAGANLLQNPAARQALITALGNLPKPPMAAPHLPLWLRFTVTGGTKISLGLAHPLALGTELQFSGGLVLDLQARTLEADLALAAEIVGSALAFQFDLALDQSEHVETSWGLALSAPPDAAVPPFAPLVLYPLPSQEAYLKQLAEEVPLFLLSSFACHMLNQFVLPRSPFASNVFKAFGLSAQQSDGSWQVVSLLGVLLHPLDWVLSAQVLGDGQGHLDLDQVGRVLNALPGNGVVGPEGITITAITNGTKGMIVAGLPFGTAATFTADRANGVSLGVDIQPALPAFSPLAPPHIDIQAGLTFGGGTGVSVNGAAQLTFELNASNSSNDAARLTIESGFARGQFTLDLTAHAGGQDYPIRLVPFGGLNQFIPSQGEIEQLLGFLVDKLGEVYSAHHSQLPAAVQEFISALQAFAQAFGVTAPDQIVPLVAAVVADPSAWLTQQFSATNIGTALKAVFQLLNDTLELQGFSFDANTNQIQFVHELGSASPPSGLSEIKISVGNRTINEQTLFGMWVEPQVSQAWLTLGAEAGLALPLTGTPQLEFTCGANLSVNAADFGLPLPQGPQLAFDLATGTDKALQFELAFYPIGNSAQTGNLVIELLPQVTFGETSGDTVQSIGAAHWLEKFAVQFLIPLVADIVLETSTVNEFLHHGIGSPPHTTPGAIFVDFGLLLESQDNYQLADLEAVFGQMTVKTIFERLLSSVLAALSGVELIRFKNGGGIAIVSQPNQAQNPTFTDYGVRVQVVDLPIIGGNATGSQPGVEVLLQLGKWPTGDEASNNWIERAGGATLNDDELGLNFFLLREDAQQNPSLHVRVELLSIGVDVKRNGNQPLVNLSGFQLGGVEPRLYLNLDADALDATQFGAAIRCDDIGLPLGPQLGSGATNNPVATNLLQTNNSNSNSNGGGPQPPNGGNGTSAVNPVFSVTAAYVKRFDLLLHGGAAGDPTGTIWFPIQRTFGPLSCRKIGVGWEQDKELLFVSFDGSVALAGLALNLVDLSVGIPVTTPLEFHNYVLELQGLDLTFEGGPVEISGGLLKSVTDNTIEYTGEVLIKAASFSISAFGSYASLDGHPSLFIFALVDAPIGGPAFFFVTGFSGGFGYNRQLIMPAQDAVQSFPLVAGISDPSVFGGKDPLVVLNQDVPPALGEYWLAAGVQFTSFELLQNSALLVVKFGREFEIALLGLSTLTLPKQTVGGLEAYVYAELQLEITFKPADGLLAATLTLTPNSYVIDENCRLTGGFAFYVWFGGEHRGQFVVTLGGYSPYFTPPDYYPVEPRLGFNWPISSEIQIAGDAYFALTPSCVMAGGGLQATYQSGDLKAWFDAQADFLIAWEPFHYDISIAVSIGASYHIHFLVNKTLTVELGASVHLWGPRLKGTAHVSWFIISFTIEFGEGDSNPNQPTTMAHYDDFYNYFLNPHSQASQSSLQAVGLTGRAVSVADDAPQSICTIQATAGLLTQFQDAQHGLTWVVRADQFTLATGTNVPATAVVLDNGANQATLANGPALGIRPMGLTAITTSHTIRIERLDSTPQPQDLANSWSWVSDTSGVPAALWDTAANNGNLSPDAKVVSGALVGIQSGSPNPGAPTEPPPPPIPLLLAFSFDPLPPRDLPLSNQGPVCKPPVADPNSIEIIETTIMAPATVSARAAVLSEVMAASATLVTTGGSLAVMAAEADTFFTAPPLLGAVCASDATHQLQTPNRRVRTTRAATPDGLPSAPQPPVLRALIRQYAHAAGVTGKAHIADRFATAHDWQAIQSHVAPATYDSAGSQHAMQLHAGATLLWQLEEASQARCSLKGDGALPLRVVTLDRFQQPLADVRLAAGETHAYMVPTDAAYLSITALHQATESACYGWRNDASLVQVTPKALLGEGVIVHPQAPVHLRRGLRRMDFGITTGRELLARNLVESRQTDSSVQRGWVDTLLPAAVRTICVLVKAEASALAELAEQVTLTLFSDVVAAQPAMATLAALEARSTPDSTGLLYQVAPSASGFVRARVNLAAGAALQGVLAWTERDVAQVKEEWCDARLPQAAAAPAAADERITQIILNAEG